ncbi:phospholipase domain-containing protein [Streptomyces sp. CC208A]|uniref:phospholipase domain-containing protein n=1 Tax=Streptomyces sp. CC208A TaxID=3044573 RepID=UPI0024A7BFBD|nr:phospholipase domain-containing protein [Streptomyces sp. CC208A]
MVILMQENRGFDHHFGTLRGVRPHASRSDGPWTYTVAAGSSREDRFNAVAYTDGGYGFTILADIDGTWSRRYTGHTETGEPSATG